jgi:hypothetical protein
MRHKNLLHLFSGYCLRHHAPPKSQSLSTIILHGINFQGKYLMILMLLNDLFRGHGFCLKEVGRWKLGLQFIVPCRLVKGFRHLKGSPSTRFHLQSNSPFIYHWHLRTRQEARRTRNVGFGTACALPRTRISGRDGMNQFQRKNYLSDVIPGSYFLSCLRSSFQLHGANSFFTC